MKNYKTYSWDWIGLYRVCAFFSAFVVVDLRFIAAMLNIPLFLCLLSVTSHSRVKSTPQNLASENSLPIRHDWKATAFFPKFLKPTRSQKVVSGFKCRTQGLKSVQTGSLEQVGFLAGKITFKAYLPNGPGSRQVIL